MSPRRFLSDIELERVRLAGVAFAVVMASGGVVAVGRAGAEAIRPSDDSGLAGRIVYTRAVGEYPWDIFVSDATGDNESQVTADETTEYDPRLSPDGSEIAYHVWKDKSPVRVLRMPAAGGTPTPVVIDDGIGYDAGYPAWSPDGRCVSYSGDHAARDGRSDLKIWCPQDGTRTVRVTDDRDESGSDWSPDGLRLAFESHPIEAASSDASYWDIYVVGVDGTDYAPLVASEGWSECDPRWSPDGRQLAFVVYPGRNCAGRGTLRTLDLDSGATADWIMLVAGSPAWSPDGRRIMVAGIVEEGPSPGPGIAAPPTPATPVSQQRGLYWVDMQSRTMGRLDGAAGGVAGGGRYAWGFSPDWWGAPVTPTPTLTTTPTASSTPTVTPTATQSGRRAWLPVAQRGHVLIAPTATPPPVSETPAPPPASETPSEPGGTATTEAPTSTPGTGPGSGASP